MSDTEYRLDSATGRILGFGNSRPFDVGKAARSWLACYANADERERVLSERKDYALKQGYLYEVQCCEDLQMRLEQYS